ncbi:MAG: M6 family metalloprotease domain-containing protein [Bacteroidaceae bacterium]|nr:M6 family metalloprotease domain-containing protein [Bacteroidaceae bacterium]
MKKLMCAIMLALAVIPAVSAQQETVSAVRLRSCRVGKPRPDFAFRRAPSSPQGENPYVGSRRQLVVLAAFQDQDFSQEPDAALQTWNRIFNAEHYAEGSFVGSVHDYFVAQSYGQFDLTFDLIYLRLPDNSYKYRSTEWHDENSQYMVDDIVDLLQAQAVDWSLYDWDGNSFVDQLLIIYAGEGMNAGGGSNTIWPHQWWLSQHLDQTTEEPDDYRGCRTVVHGDREYRVDCYCCVQEVVNDITVKSSFGTLCHEYSHCFGLPDFYYDASVVGDWDLMDTGNYNGQGFRPCNYSAHERMLLGWIVPLELGGTTTITDMPALDAAPVAYLIRNDGAENEYYIVENRQQQGWDESLPASGIIVFHIDYDKDLWQSTSDYVNTSGQKRYRIIPANNSSRTSKAKGWAYPYVTEGASGNGSLVNDSLTNTSVPPAMLNNPNLDGRLLMSKPITRMAVDADGHASFLFMKDNATPVSELPFHRERGVDAAIPMYDLQGRSLSAPANGPYIQGKRLILKNE